MPIEGPLKELGLHDVFQLLDLSRKTGTMRVISHLRNNEGMVAFDGGAIVYAEIRSNPMRIGELLVKSGRITEADLERARTAQQKEKDAGAPPRRLGMILVSMGVLNERDLLKQVERQVTEVSFELLSWQEGFFSFTEGALTGVPADAMVRIRTETVLMEGARRIDEWSRIESHIPHLGVVPMLAPSDGAASADMALLDLLPGEWEVLAQVDSERDVRDIAQTLARSDFEVARVLFGLVSTGIVALHDPGIDRKRLSGSADAASLLAAAEVRLESGDIEAAKEAAMAAASLRPGDPRVHLVLARAHLRESRPAEAVEESRRAVRLDPLSLDAHRWFGLSLVASGRFAEAGEQFTQWERLATSDTPARDREMVATAKAATHLLANLLGGLRG